MKNFYKHNCYDRCDSCDCADSCDYHRCCPPPCCCPCSQPCCDEHPHDRKCGCVPKPDRGDCCSVVSVNSEGRYQLSRLKIDNGPLTNTDYNFAAYNFNPRDIDPVGMQSASGMIYFSRIELSCPVNLSQLFMGVTDAGSGLTAGQSFVGIYDANGNLLVLTPDQSGLWTVAGLYGIPVTETHLPIGRYYLAILSNGAQPPEFVASQAGAAALNVFLTAPNLAYGQLPNQATLPAMVDLNTLTPPPIGQRMPWIALG